MPLMPATQSAKQACASIIMAEHEITQRSSPQQPHELVYIPRKREELQVFLVGTRSSIYRPSQRRLLLIFLLCSCGLLFIYINWELLVLHRFHNGPPGQARQAADSSLAETLEKKVRVLCWVLTTPKYHKTRAVHIQRTWGKRCNKIYFMTSEPDDELETIVLTKPDQYEVLWGKTKEAFTYIYRHKLDEADWFMKADDDTYVFVENLRYMLYPYDPNMAIYFGFNYKLMENHDAVYMSGGSGYVLSREALRQFVHGLNDSSKCRQEDNSAEDVEAGRCLHNMGVLAGDSRDTKLRYRFYPLAPYTQLMSHYNGMDFWLFKYAYYNPRACMNCLSDYPVAFHYVSPEELYVYDYFSYKFGLVGRRPVLEHLPERIKPEQLIIPPSDNIY